MVREFVLWGIDVPIVTPMHSVVIARPIVRVNDRLLLASSYRWSSEHGLVHIDDADADVIGTRAPASDVIVAEGTAALVVSPQHVADLYKLNLNNLLPALRWTNWNTALVGFDDVESLRQSSQRIATGALAAFEATLHDSRRRPAIDVLDTARRALIGWPGLPLEHSLVSQLMYLYLAHRGTEYDVLLAYAAGVLGQGRSELDRSVKRRLEVSLGVTYGIVSKPSARASVSDLRTEMDYKSAEKPLGIDTYKELWRRSLSSETSEVARE